MKRWRDVGWGEEKGKRVKVAARNELPRKRIDDRRKRIGVYLSGDSSISRKSLFMGTREPRRTTAQKRRNELSTCLMQGIHNNKYCIWLAPLPCLNNNTSISHLFLVRILNPLQKSFQIPLDWHDLTLFKLGIHTDSNDHFFFSNPKSWQLIELSKNRNNW